MSLRHGTLHGMSALVAALLAVKLLIKKGLFLIDDLATHLALKAPLELVLVELPVTVFEPVGRSIVQATGTSLPPTSLGIVAVYPVIVTLVVIVAERPGRRGIVGYWLGATAITAAAVAASLGMAPDPAGAGSGLAYHLEHHTLAELFRSVVLTVGASIAAIAAVAGVDLDPTIGLVVTLVVVAVGYGLLWELGVGHD